MKGISTSMAQDHPAFTRPLDSGRGAAAPGEEGADQKAGGEGPVVVEPESAMTEAAIADEICFLRLLIEVAFASRWRKGLPSEDRLSAA